jgi:hypothetical protein
LIRCAEGRVMSTNEPPKILVMTWLELLKTSDNEEIKSHAAEMLIATFGSEQVVADYLAKNNIAV